MVASGQAPNNFSIPRGRYRIDVTKPNYQGQTRIVDIDLGETKPLFFKLDPIPARLEIETIPPGATLYVNGNRARNPYRQDVAPGHIEIFAEATDYDDADRRPGAGTRRAQAAAGARGSGCDYIQRSGRPELVVASALMGGLLGRGRGRRGDRQGPRRTRTSRRSLLVSGGGIAGAVAGALVATPLVPQYIPDNQALFILGGDVDRHKPIQRSLRPIDGQNVAVGIEVCDSQACRLADP